MGRKERKDNSSQLASNGQLGQCLHVKAKRGNSYHIRVEKEDQKFPCVNICGGRTFAQFSRRDRVRSGKTVKKTQSGDKSDNANLKL